MDSLADLRQVMHSFQDGTLTPTDFVDRYSEVWDELMRELDAAIEAQPAVGDELRRLRRRQADGEITADEYSVRVQAQYARLNGVRVRPGTHAAEVVDQVYAVADAYSGGDIVSEDELHATVDSALDVLERAQADVQRSPA